MAWLAVLSWRSRRCTSASSSRAIRLRSTSTTVMGRTRRSRVAARVAESSRVAPPGARSASSTCRRLRMRVRSATRSSRATGRSRRWWRAAVATEQASARSVLRALLVDSSRARAASLAGTSTTCSPAATRSWAMPRPRPLAPSTAQRRWGQTAAQASSCRAAWAVVGTRSWPSSRLLESSAAAVRERLWGSIPMVITGGLSSRRDGVRDGQPDFRWAHASVEPRHGGCRPRSGTLSASQPGGGKEPASQTAGTLDATGCRPARPNRDSTSQEPVGIRPVAVLSARPAGATTRPVAREDGTTTMAQPPLPRVTIGVDTHKHTHVAAARDQQGRRLATTMAPATRAGYATLLAWALGLGEPVAWGVEGTGSYGAGLARFLAAHGQRVLEVNRPDRAARRRHGKSDPVDADAAARAVQAGEATGTPKAQDGMVELLRALRVARQTAVKARTQAINAIKGLLVTAPTGLRQQLAGLSTTRLVGQAAALNSDTLTTPTAAAMLALRGLAQRYQHLDAEITLLTGTLDQLTANHAPALRELLGVGPDSAAALLIAAGDNPSRLRSEAAFAALCGTSPVEASSGKTRRHRLNRGGDRQANAALHRIVVVRLRWHQPTRDYVARRTAEGKTSKEIIRCLKR